MAQAVALRALVMVTLAAHRVIKWAEGPAADTLTTIPESLWHRLRDPAESDSELEAAVAASTGRLSSVVLINDPFELRKLQVVFSFAGGSTRGEDSRVTTFHFCKLAGSTPVDAWDEADFVAVETALDAWWTSLKPSYNASYVLDELRWYKAGPDIEPPQEPVRVIDRNAPGTSTAALQLPPQVACSVTERTSSRKAWGRSYLIAPVAGAVTASQGRWHSTFHTTVANAYDALYEACKTANVPVVVYSPAKPERETKAGGTLAAIGARAFTVDTIQVDDVPDVLRSRRFDAPLLKLVRGIGS
jgi:hypothetical protein